ncbi:TM2 domain-containing protein [Scatolibacter rhodanostii]|uniref:TM2 domain-containing protein n=1 Tax=Scatolibacter rhodanostii TaxID=2014781 RepID=UPI000C087C7A|nr:TM2 domain-containing protein [Scatolibacter rhodanostii]
MNCPNCNADVTGCVYCPHCGQQVPPSQPSGEHVPPDFYNQYRYQYQYSQNEQNQQNQQYQPPQTPPPYDNSAYQQPPIHVNFYTENQQQQYAASYKSRLAALLLCIFLGVLGVHRFYTGKIGTGLLWLFTGGLFGIGYIVDIILIATGSFTDQYGYPLLYW